MGKLAEIKTKETTLSVEDFINTVQGEEKRKDSLLLVELMQKATKEKPKMWGKSMIGFGKKVYKSPTSGREVEWFIIGFSPRKANLSVHLINMQQDDLQKLGKHKAGTGCLYINKLADINVKVLEKMIHAAAKIN